jgi:hypothetical protein
MLRLSLLRFWSWCAVCILVHLPRGSFGLTPPTFTDFSVSPVAEYGIKVSWSADVDNPGGEMNLTLHNNTGAWKTAVRVPFNARSYVMNGLTVNVEYWFTTTWWRHGIVNFTVDKMSNKIWGQKYPAPPVNVGSEYSDGKVNISFAAPTDDGGSPIAHFYIEKRTQDHVNNQTLISSFLVGSKSTYIVVTVANGEDSAFAVATVNFLGNSTLVAVPPAKNSAVSFGLVGTVSASKTFPDMGSFLSRVRDYLIGKIRASGRRRRRLLADGSEAAVGLELVQESNPLYESDNVTFTIHLRAKKVTLQDASALKTHVAHANFLSHVKSLSGFNSTGRNWTVHSLKEIQGIGAAGPILPPAISFEKIHDRKAVLRWTYSADQGTPSIRGGGYVVSNYRVVWHAAPANMVDYFRAHGDGPAYLGMPCVPPFTPFPCNGTNISSTSLFNKDLGANTFEIDIATLVNGMAYRFSLEITNAFGNVLTVSSPTYVPAGPPKSVSLGTFVPSDRSIRLSWTLSENYGNGRPVEKFVLQGLMENGVDNTHCSRDTSLVPNITLVGGHQREGSVTELVNERVYSVRLKTYVYYGENSVTSWSSPGNPVNLMSSCGVGKGVRTSGPPLMSNKINASISRVLNKTYTIVVNWQAARDNGDMTTAYRVEARPEELHVNGSTLGAQYYESMTPALLKTVYNRTVYGNWTTKLTVSNETTFDPTTNTTTNGTIISKRVFDMPYSTELPGLHTGVQYGIYVYGKNNRSGYGLPGKSRTFILHQGAPQTVSTPSAKPIVNQVGQVAWTVPYHGGALIEHYEITVFQHAPRENETKQNLPCNTASTIDTMWVINTTLTTVVTGEAATKANVYHLQNGHCYRFKVTAYNALGKSPSSPISNAIVPTDRPLQVMAVNATAGDAQIVLKWKIPGSNGAQIDSYKIVLKKVYISFPEGLDQTDPADTFVQDPEYTLDVPNTWAQSEGSWASFTMTYPAHPIYNGDGYVVHVAANNSVGVGEFGTHDDGTDASVLMPIVVPQEYATVTWAHRTNGTGLANPVVHSLRGETKVYYCTTVSVKEQLSHTNIIVRDVGSVSGYGGTDGSYFWSFNSPQLEPFIFGESNPCPVFSSDLMAYVVSATESPANSHVFRLAGKGTQHFRQNFNGNPKFENIDDYQDGNNWLLNGSTSIDMEFDFLRTHEATVIRPWTENLQEIKSEYGQVKETDDLEVRPYRPAIRANPALSRKKVLFATASDKYVYAYDVEDPASSTGQLMRFPYSMCDLDQRMAYPEVNTALQQQCGCPGYSPDNVSPLKAPPVLVEDAALSKSILLVSSFNGASSTVSALDVLPMVTNKRKYHYNALNCTDPNRTSYVPPQENEIKKLWVHNAENSLSDAPVWVRDKVIFRDGPYLVCLNLYNGSRLWTFSVDCGDAGASDGTLYGAPLSRTAPSPVCDYVDVANRSDLRDSLNMTIRITDVYLPVDENHKYPSRGSDRDAVYIRSTIGKLHAIDLETGALIFEYSVGPKLHSHPVRNWQKKEDNMIFVSTYTGKLYGLACPPNAHVVLSRVVYVCPELTIAVPTQEDLCNELERPCPKVVDQDPYEGGTRNPVEWAMHPNPYT